MNFIQIKDYFGEIRDVELLGDDGVISVASNEIAIVQGDFAMAEEQGLFKFVEVDEFDSIKLIGITKNGVRYVSEKLLAKMSDDELRNYNQRLKMPDGIIEVSNSEKYSMGVDLSKRSY